MRSRSLCRLAPDLDPALLREARDDALAGHDVGSTVGDPRSRRHAIRDHRREREQLPLERLLDRIEHGADGSRPGQSTRRVQVGSWSRYGDGKDSSTDPCS